MCFLHGVVGVEWRMPLRTLDEFPALLSRHQCLLGVDYGSKMIGLAISDPSLSLAAPLVVLERGKFSAVREKLEKIIKEREVGALVIGLPLQLDGKLGAMGQAVRTFASNLDKAFAPEIAFWDERFSTAMIQRELIEVADMSRAKRAAVVDKLAASYILQGALDYLKNRKENPLL